MADPHDGGYNGPRGRARPRYQEDKMDAPLNAPPAADPGRDARDPVDLEMRLAALTFRQDVTTANLEHARRTMTPGMVASLAAAARAMLAELDAVMALLEGPRAVVRPEQGLRAAALLAARLEALEADQRPGALAELRGRVLSLQRQLVEARAERDAALGPQPDEPSGWQDWGGGARPRGSAHEPPGYSHNSLRSTAPSRRFPMTDDKALREKLAALAEDKERELGFLIGVPGCFREVALDLLREKKEREARILVLERALFKAAMQWCRGIHPPDRPCEVCQGAQERVFAIYKRVVPEDRLPAVLGPQAQGGA